MKQVTPSYRPGSDEGRYVLAVVVACFNVEKEVAGVIRRLPSWVASIVAVDDASTDSTATVLNELAAEDPKLTVIHPHCTGMSVPTSG